MTISKRDAKMLIILLGIVILLICYLTIYTPYSNRTEKLKTEIAALKPKLAELQGYQSKLETYKAGIAGAKETISSETARYPAGIRTEDLVMYAIDLEEKAGAKITSMAFAGPTPLSSFQVPAADGARTDITAECSTLTLTCGMTYAQMKSMLSYISSGEYRTALDTLSVSFDTETGQLVSTAVLKKYSLSGTGEEAPADIPGVQYGTRDLFGSYAAKAAGTAASSAAANAKAG